MTEYELENLIDKEGRELLRRLLQAHLDERGPGKVCEPVIDKDQQEHTHQREQERIIKTIFGPVTLERQSYGGRGLVNLRPLDAELNLPEKEYSHTLQRRIVLQAVQGSYDQAVASVEEMNGVKVGKRQAEEEVVCAAQDFTLFYETQRAQSVAEVKASSELLLISADGKGVPLRKDDLREATQKAAAERTPRLDHRRSKGEKSNTKRMSAVAAVYTIAPFVRAPEDIVREFKPEGEALPVRPQPEDKRVWASLADSPETVIKQAFEEAERRDPQQLKKWGALVDGNKNQISLLQAKAKAGGVALVIILDLIHVLEYLWKATWAFHSAGDPDAEVWVQERLVEILLGNSSRVAAGIRRSATLRGLPTKQREPVDRCADYLLNNREFLHYDKYLEQGFPIATGVIEGACRYLVKDRMEITGARWSLQGADALLKLRSLVASGDFDQYWEFHMQQEYKRNHADHYAEGKVPKTVSKLETKRKGSHLRRVK